jgi:pimeloyl-ACP methyl ester carboxylesterase
MTMSALKTISPKKTVLALAILVVCSLRVAPGFAATAQSQVVSRELRSENLAHSKIGTDPMRKMVVYLPAGYDQSSQRYPVIYFLPNPARSYRADFDQRGAQGLFDRAIASGVINKFILVSVDMNTPLGCSWYVNSPVTGNWEDFMIQELVPYIDANFKTLPNRDSRGIAGDSMGGHGAIRFAMKHPDIFGSVYALHPVGTGTGVQTMYSRPNWDVLAHAKSMDDLRGDGFLMIFTSIFQAHLPDPDKPPLYVDLPAHKEGDKLVVNSELTGKLLSTFSLQELVPKYADNLKSLRGFKFDWARSDENPDHIYSNQAFTHKLNEFGVVHEAEEYNGTWGEPNWGEDGRIYNDLLPFFQKHLVFAAP